MSGYGTRGSTSGTRPSGNSGFQPVPTHNVAQLYRQFEQKKKQENNFNKTFGKLSYTGLKDPYSKGGRRRKTHRRRSHKRKTHRRRH